MALKGTYDTAKQATRDVIAPQVQEINGEIAGLRGEMLQLEKRFEESLSNRRMDEGLASVHHSIDEVSQRTEEKTSDLTQPMDEGFTQVNRRNTNKRLDETINIRERLAALEGTVRGAPQHQ